MALTVLYEIPGLTQDQYDKIIETLQSDGITAPGRIYHVAGPMEGGWQVVDVFESREAFEQFIGGSLVPVMQKLGLTPEREAAGGLFYRCSGDTQFFLFESQGAALGTHTQAGWITDDIEAEVAALKARGLVFEVYDTPYLKTVNSVAITGPVKAAWFKDSEGNLLGFVQFV